MMHILPATVGFLTLTEEDSMNLPDNLTLDTIMEAVQEDDHTGFCIACGEQHYSIEPDARRYECERCGAHSVYGAEELLIMFG